MRRACWLCSLCLLLCAPAFADQMPGLVGAWLERGLTAGTNANGWCSPGARIVGGIVQSNGVLLSGAGFVTIGSNRNTLAGSPEMTASIWFQTTNSLSGIRYLFTEVREGLNKSFLLGIQPPDIVYAYVYNGAQTNLATVSLPIAARNMTDLKWHHMAMTWSGGSNVLVYKDGIQYVPALSRTSTLMSAMGSPSNADLRIGSDTANNFGAQCWIGYLSQAALYRRALTSNEVASMYRTRRPDTDLPRAQ